MRNGDVSFWQHDLGSPARRAPLAGDDRCDVAIVGGGLTGLWSAYYLAAARPDLDVRIVERRFAGYGASGRNGGWLSAELSGSRERYAAAHGRAAVVSLLAAMREAVDEVIDVAASEGIDADIVKAGTYVVARNRAQLARLHADVAWQRDWGATDADVRVLDAAELDGELRVAGARAATFTPHCARVHPAKLVRGVAAAVERRGVTIHEGTTALAVEAGAVRTDRGTLRARHVLRCLEGFTAGLPGARREWLPMNSSMIVTAALPADVRAAIGWRDPATLGDFAHAYVYAQLTADGRIALGGRGNPYRFGSRTDVDGRTQPGTVAALTAMLHDLFPATAGVAVEHAWCGVLGVPRDWCTTVAYDAGTGLGTAGGYVGNGLTTTNLAGRTLADLVLGRETALTGLAWVGRDVRRWEPEPLRWQGVQGMYALYRTADRRERRPGSRETSRWARVADRLSGR
ncbi:Glycine/D-amino acid oxidase [Jatrophihabitans endophyticus]|uniref:Glycine/D-amino acid oxidase n=1 Tax=Jatrophihabitans endophyticus TaxID=1206085 RepID=A0A1M5M1L8_9ACTN|nr:FAD-dependent oxidoreductase [Jatrophihabitans endophyticus]SHG71232.1 Glycine/D-amino acid oxidase [Jatrophihabitans endophyticus]